jgi:predicted nucleic acid-binding protein
MGTVVLDASVVLALFDPIDDHHVAAAVAVRRCRDAGDTFKVPASAVAEALVGACRQRSEERRLAQIERTFGPLRPIDSAVAIAAARLRANHRSLRLPDAIILAVAQVDNADVILTVDKAWRKYDQRVRLIP